MGNRNHRHTDRDSRRTVATLELGPQVTTLERAVGVRVLAELAVGVDA